MERMTANFYPASEPTRFEGHPFTDQEGNQKMTEGGIYLGKANITIANALRINDISAFLYDSGKFSISFPEYELGGEKHSFVVPQSPEAYAAMCGVVESARESAQGFAFTQGTYNPQMSVRGRLVEEEFADGRYSVQVGDVCTLRGLSTREAEYTQDGKTRHFISVDLPNIHDPATGKASSYEKDGETHYNKVFEPLVSKWTSQSGEKRSKDYGRVLNHLVLRKRSILRLAEKDRESQLPELDKKVENARGRAEAQKPSSAPMREPEMSM